MLGIVIFYAALAAWIPLLYWSAKKKKWALFFMYGGVFAIILNMRYVVEGMEGGIMFFTGIFDVVAHLGIGKGETPAILTTCAGNDCTVLTSYETHPSWAVAFYDRFAQGPSTRVALLYGHIIFNTIALVSATIQIFRPGGQYKAHKLLGRISFVSVVISLTCAGILTAELSDVVAYGHWWTTFGLYFLALTTIVPATLGIVFVVKGDLEKHRIWMWRYTGAIWGAYWIFRAEMLLVDLLVKDAEGLTLAVPSWTSGLIGIALAEIIRRRVDQSTHSSPITA
ncbi:DUF2306 domain-containing protein [Donghicola mangrovi]|uniref:DUF2306 domain-containing protein n=1 Tax=Donghicola mangrovi TaxID=2729614 RepID=A0A850QBE7_9RHOB|nr:DUF2306 domain-containing protein [Donghicola mangrovi]NVO25672.1 DUF2306 domain-containing protein [Donghicola mangrovi]